MIMRKPILRIFSLMLIIAMFLAGEVIAQEEVWDETQEAAHFETCYSDICCVSLLRGMKLQWMRQGNVRKR